MPPPDWEPDEEKSPEIDETHGLAPCLRPLLLTAPPARESGADALVAPDDPFDFETYAPGWCNVQCVAPVHIAPDSQLAAAGEPSASEPDEDCFFI